MSMTAFGHVQWVDQNDLLKIPGGLSQSMLTIIWHKEYV